MLILRAVVDPPASSLQTTAALLLADRLVLGVPPVLLICFLVSSFSSQVENLLHAQASPNSSLIPPPPKSLSPPPRTPCCVLRVAASSISPHFTFCANEDGRVRRLAVRRRQAVQRAGEPRLRGHRGLPLDKAVRGSRQRGAVHTRACRHQASNRFGVDAVCASFRMCIVSCVLVELELRVRLGLDISAATPC